MFPNGPVPFLYWFHSVAPGGQWDYKSVGHTGAQAAYDDMMGNFNFCATGSVLFDQTTIFSDAGTVQLLTNPAGGQGGMPFVSPPYGDDLLGQEETKQGINGGC